MKKLVVGVLCTSMLLSLASCGKADNEYKIKKKQTTVISALSNSYENGIIYVSNGICNFYDYDSDISIPLCFKPNCTHNDNNCIAKIIAESSNGVAHSVIFNDSIYYFTETESIEGEGKTTAYNIQSTLHKCDLKSGEETDVLEISDLDCTSSVNMVLNDTTIYFTASNGAYQFEDGTWAKAGFGKQHLCSVDLENYSFENLGLVNDNKYVSNSVVITENSINAVADQVIISGVYNDKIYLYYSYVEDKNIIINAIENNDFNIDWEYEVKELSLSSREISASNEQPPICLNEDWYVTEDKIDKIIVAKDKVGNTVEFSSVNELPFDCYQYSIYNNKIWDLYNGIVYDLLTKETYEISEDFFGANVVDYIADDNKYVVCIYDAAGNLIYEKVDEDTIIVRK